MKLVSSSLVDIIRNRPRGNFPPRGLHTGAARLVVTEGVVEADVVLTVEVDVGLPPVVALHRGLDQALTASQPQPEVEESRPEQRELDELLHGDGMLQQLVLRRLREELKDELVGVREEIVVLVDLPRLPGGLGVDLHGGPVGLDQPPASAHVDGVPGISPAGVGELL